MTQSIAAQTFESDGLKYTILDDKEWTVSLAGAVDANITNLDIPSTVPYYPGGNVAGKIDCTVVEIGTRAFYQCSSLTAVRMTSSVLNIRDRAFESCTSLKSITLSDNITYIGDSSFTFCNTLESIVMPTGLKGIGAYAFQYCQALCDVTLNEGLESIGGDAFSNNDAMREIEFPSTLSYIGGSAFYRCNVLNKVTFNGAVGDIGFRAFDYSFQIKEVYGKDVESWCRMGFRDSTSNPLTTAKHLYLAGAPVVDLVIPGNIDVISSYTFYGLETLKSLSICDGVTKIGEAAFRYTTSLETVEFGNTLEHIGANAFGYSSIINLVFPNSLKTLGKYAFERCEQLETINWSTGMETVYENAFSYNGMLKDVNISDLSAWCKVTFQGNSNPLNFAHRLSLNDEEIIELVIPEDIEDIKDYAFEGCAGFKSVKISDNVKSIGTHAFWNCSGIQSLHIGTGLNELDLYKFGGSSEIKNLYIADGGETISIISPDDWGDGWATPKKISNLYLGRNFTVTGTLAPDVQLLTFGPDVSEANENSYGKYSKLLMITDYSSNPPAIQAFTEDQYANVVVRVPVGCTETYKTAEYWKDFTFITDSQEYALENIKIDFDSDSYTIYPTKFRPSELSYTISPEKFQTLPVEYISSDESLLRFNGLEPSTYAHGEAIVTARLLANNAVAETTVTTYAAPESISLECGEELTLREGNTFQFNAVVEPGPFVPEMVTWRSSNSSLTIDENGLATAIRKAKNIRVTATTYNGKKATCNVQIEAVNTSIDEVESDSEEIFDVYTTSGVLLKTGSTSKYRESLPMGIYILRNATKTVKLIKPVG